MGFPISIKTLISEFCLLFLSLRLKISQILYELMYFFLRILCKTHILGKAPQFFSVTSHGATDSLGTRCALQYIVSYSFTKYITLHNLKFSNLNISFLTPQLSQSQILFFPTKTAYFYVFCLICIVHLIEYTTSNNHL